MKNVLYFVKNCELYYTSAYGCSRSYICLLIPDHTSPFVPTPPPAITLAFIPELSDAQMEVGTGHHWYGVETPFDFEVVASYGQPNDTVEPKSFRLDGILGEDAATEPPVVAFLNDQGEVVLEVMLDMTNGTILLSSSVNGDSTPISYPTKLGPGEPFSLTVEYDAEAGMFVVVMEDDFGPIEFEVESGDDAPVIASTQLDGDMGVTFTGYVEEGQYGGNLEEEIVSMKKMRLFFMFQATHTVPPSAMFWSLGVRMERCSSTCLLYTSPSPRD